MSKVFSDSLNEILKLKTSTTLLKKKLIDYELSHTYAFGTTHTTIDNKTSTTNTGSTLIYFEMKIEALHSSMVLKGKGAKTKFEMKMGFSDSSQWNIFNEKNASSTLIHHPATFCGNGMYETFLLDTEPPISNQTSNATLKSKKSKKKKDKKKIEISASDTIQLTVVRVGDVVGCGWDQKKKWFYITLNGKRIKGRPILPASINTTNETNNATDTTDTLHQNKSISLCPGYSIGHITTTTNGKENEPIEMEGGNGGLPLMKSIEERMLGRSKSKSEQYLSTANVRIAFNFGQSPFVDPFSWERILSDKFSTFYNVTTSSNNMKEKKNYGGWSEDDTTNVWLRHLKATLVDEGFTAKEAKGASLVQSGGRTITRMYEWTLTLSSFSFLNFAKLKNNKWYVQKYVFKIENVVNYVSL